MALSSDQRTLIAAVEDNPAEIWSRLAFFYQKSSSPLTTTTGLSLTISSSLKRPLTAPTPRHLALVTSPALEFAGHAKICSYDPSDPMQPLQLDASTDWSADTGATSHMTPHRHWLFDDSPKCVPIRLVDNKVVYSAGTGSILFQPVIGGRKMRQLILTNVLHVPDLRNNLISVLYLCHQKGFTVKINSSRMSFERPAEKPLFIASIQDNNSAYLDGETIPVPQSASPAITVPLNLDLWHRRLAHHNLAGVRTLLK